MKKAQAKMDKLGILKPIVAAIVVVVTAVLAVATLGASLGLVAMAMLGGFLYGGLHGGHGFNLTDAFNNASMAGGVLPQLLHFSPKSCCS